ncbi:unnamed protein product [Paramecium pentaurelia]|uniref:Uncharacterized protein n=1 Tax=Paramecium pentaurelia TaxID=43138 RepID=A0A8S1UPI4_9CILI|nr:unnamed protein product [Paramecium pentaurelia]
MKAIQWFVYQEKCIYNLIKNIYNVKKSYDLILEGITYLLKSCLFYIRTDFFKCFYILQITTSLSKVIFSFHLMNEQRYMKFVTKHELIDICDEIKQQIDIEKE